MENIIIVLKLNLTTHRNMLLLYIVCWRDRKGIRKSKRRKASSVYVTFTK